MRDTAMSCSPIWVCCAVRGCTREGTPRLHLIATKPAGKWSAGCWLARIDRTLPSSARFQFFGRFPDIPRRGAVVLAKAAVEIRKVAKAHVIGNRAHLM